MKKIIKTILIIIIMLFAIPIVNATEQKEVFKLDWDTEELDLPLMISMISKNNTYYKKGYVTTDTNAEEIVYNEKVITNIIRYSQSGEILKRVTLENYLVFDLIDDEEYLYAFVYGIDNSIPEAGIPDAGANVETTAPLIKIIKYDSELIKQKEIDITFSEEEQDSAEMIILMPILSKLIGIEMSSIKDNTISFVAGNGIKQVDTDLTKITDIPVVEGQEQDLYKYLDGYDVAMKRMQPIMENDPNSLLIGFDIDDNLEVYGGAEDLNKCMGTSGTGTSSLESIDIGDVLANATNFETSIFANINGAEGECASNIKAKLLFYKDDKEVFAKVYDDYMYFLNPHIISNYIVTIGLNMNEETGETEKEIAILDLEGNLLQKINTAEKYLSIVEGTGSFMTTASNASANCPVMAGSNAGPIEDCYAVKNVVYYIPLNVKTSVPGGNGTITVDPNSRVGEDVVFTVTPEEGYVLGAIKVTDYDGNELDVKFISANTFTMPSTDVIIEVQFVTNPDTSDIALIIVASAIIIITAIVLIQKNKMNWIKE